MTPDEKLWCLDGDGPFWAGLGYLAEGGLHKSPFRASAVERVGLAGFAFCDGPRGVVVDQATCFPVSMARGATWDVDLEERIGEAMGQELRAVGADLFGGVCVNVLRHPAWGRAQETYGEDPHHVGEMGAALTRGVQRHTMACVKHFACNSMENARFTVDITVDEVALHEVYLPHFRRIVDEGVAVVMSAYNSVNGEWCGQNRTLLTDVLRTEWGFEGFVISDWILGLRDAGASLAAGLDVEMPYRMIRATHLVEDLDSGEATWAQVDQAVERVVATRARFAEVLDRPAPDRSVLASPAHRALAREAAAKSVVLLRNEPVNGSPVLPLSLSPGSTVALFGPLATAVNLGDGGSSDVWAPEVVTVAQGLEAALSGITVVHDDGTDPARAAAVAGGADVAVVVAGYTRLDEGEYIGEFATAHLAHLFPGEDDPALVARFNEQIADERSIVPPAYAVAQRGRRRVRRRRGPLLAPPTPRRRRAHRVGGRGQPPHRGGPGGRKCGGGVRVGPVGAGGGAVVVLGDGRGTWRGRRAAREGGRLGTAPVLGAGGGVRSAALRRQGRSLRLRPVARLLAPGPPGHRSGLSVRLRTQLHLVRPGVGRGRGGRR